MNTIHFLALGTLKFQTHCKMNKIWVQIKNQECSVAKHRERTNTHCKINLHSTGSLVTKLDQGLINLANKGGT